ncbi:MAG: transposase [Nitrospira sp.]|nr:transposase [Nitrospira sp.]
MGRNAIQSTEAVWRDRLARFGKCKLTVKEFCRQEGVSDPSFYQWRKRLQKDPAGSRHRRRMGQRSDKSENPQSFVPVRVSSTEVLTSSILGSVLAEVELPNGVRIRVPATHSEALRIAILTGNEVCREVV